MFPITYWYGVPAAQATRERYEEVAEAGFTIAQFGGTPEQILRTLGWCASVGIAGMVIDSRMPNPRQPLPDDWRDRLRDIVADYRESPALWGYFVTDEPSADEFSRLRDITDELRRLDPDRPSYINLYPHCANEEQMGVPTYEEHVRRYVDEVAPHLVSYDHYCFRKAGVLRGGYFANLETIRRHSFRVGLDFWQIVLSTPLFDWPDIGEAELRWQAWTSLAYGAKGISFYTYWGIESPPHWNAIIDVYGNRTTHYPMIRNTNLGVAAVGEHLLNLSPVSVQHGSGTEGKSVGERSCLTECPNDRIIVGEFRQSDGGDALILVNDDLVYGAKAILKLKDRYTGYREVSRVSGTPGGVRSLGGDDESILEVFLAPGDGTLILLETEDTK